MDQNKYLNSINSLKIIYKLFFYKSITFVFRNAPFVPVNKSKLQKYMNLYFYA